MFKSLVCTLLLFTVLFTTASAQDQAAKDEQILKEYFAKNHIKATRTASGLYYTIDKKGEGPNVKPGQQVNVNYLGRFLDGNKFDGNVDEKYAPVAGRSVLSFTVGTGRVIAGWEEGLLLLNKGCRATLYLPSALAYGSAGNGRIPANSVLMFNVEMVSFN
ncbi:MAG: FKBP-type peptidyl-prolyl cis-trans isomerase [Bacteroidetes bacterium]|nr:FKBP-type peptidyl-prolyl cis-trans isomerase [Bacteroidota bacterium]